MLINSKRLWENLQALGKIGATKGGGVTRLSLSPEDFRARDQVVAWARPWIDEVFYDQVGNLFLIRHGNDPDLPLILCGSHLDSQIEGGKFDGVYGVLAGIEILQTLGENQKRLPCGFAVVNWTNEEEVRYCPAMGSAVFSGKLNGKEVLNTRGNDGSIFGEELQKIGYAGSEKSPHRFKVYLETHIEQGPILEEAGLDIGIVTGAQGQVTFKAEIMGAAGHSGTVPMNLRQDALSATAHFISDMFQLIKNEGEGVFTVGRLENYPNSTATIPSRVKFTIDLRHPYSEKLDIWEKEIKNHLTEMAHRFRCQSTICKLSHKEPITFDQGCIRQLLGAAHRLKYRYQTMVSGATHDACFLAQKIPTAMVFIPCYKGISHHPDEYASRTQIEKGANVLLSSILELSKN